MQHINSEALEEAAASLVDQHMDVVRISYSDIIGSERGRDLLVNRFARTVGGGLAFCRSVYGTTPGGHVVELGGAQIREGDKVVMWFASGNRDESVFDDPYTLDLTRVPNEHVTFGKGGPHFCLGSALARMEITLMFEALLPRIKSIELAADVTRVRSNFVNGIKKFPVRVTPA